MTFGRITGWGIDLPERILTNDELSKMVDTSDEWIRERSGISTRHIDGKVSEMSTNAGKAALEKAGVKPEEIDLFILATTTADKVVPATSSIVQNNLGLSCGAFDLNAACSGFVYGLVTAMQFADSGMQKILLIGSDSLSTFTDWEDRTTCVLFGDGAGAVVIERTSDQPCFLGWDLMADGSAADLLYCEHGGKIIMHGQEVFRRAVIAMENAANTAMEKAGVTSDEISLVIPHQANVRIIDTAMKRLGIAKEKAALVMDRTGNTSAASIPLALIDSIDSGRVEQDDLLLLVGFGAGMTSAAAVLRWNSPAN
ncbi:MAG TPA: beta-ketoacyl-ACP synthase III [Acidimicrobiales bacterium]|jgi:3-oxoacyl-[acyl-carrier-protein] synthase-3|nr:beta-ketoacyl-ACP synthase III [Acidimicrobiales bacterium]HJM37406.1 beta-ketoacyl-ACP synthase III [Acidimicrobiales bacterium]|tara:strand:+ start:487 stop:1422 length:936 start_codon:yes stop_codon:yes gene_type:complete